MINDISCFYGPWTTHPVQGDVRQVSEKLKRIGIDRGYISPLAAVWCRNQHLYNCELLELTSEFENLLPVPVLDVSVPTWQEECIEMCKDTRVKMFRVFLNYTYWDQSMHNLKEIFKFFAEKNIPVIFQRRMEDRRYNHKLAQVQDADINNVVIKYAMRVPELKLVIGAAAVAHLNSSILDHKGIYLDTSMLEELKWAREAFDNGLGGRLLLGSHIPIFEENAGFSRFLPQLADDEAEMVFDRNFEKLLNS
ncbi:MAG: hypothetical protein GY750_07535 [Lentisphaerae bacterium]|nr:hypothetical protein [Lentisphaerota bacterium]MCP4101259.1 hypothetical protein [Lentisphaerota bacterium]